MNEERDDGLALPPPPAQRRGGIVRRSFALARAHWVVAGLSAFALILPVALLSAFVDRRWIDDTGTTLDAGVGVTTSAGNAFVQFLEGVIVTPWIIAAALLVVIGRHTSAGEAVGAGLRRLPAAVGAMVLSGVAAMLPLVPAALLFAANLDAALDGMGPMAGADDVPAGLALAGLLFLLGLPPVIFIGLSLGLAVPLAVADGARPAAAMRASWSRMNGQRLRLLGGMLALILPTTIALGMASLPFSLLVLVMGSTTGWILQGVLDGLFTAALVVVAVSVYAVVRADTAPWDAPVPGDPEARREAPAS